MRGVKKGIQLMIIKNHDIIHERPLVWYVGVFKLQSNKAGNTEKNLEKG